MADKVQFELVSPERLLVSRAVDMVVVPGSEGDFGVMPDHAPVISTVRPGVIEIYEGDIITDRIFVAGGFAEVTADRCTVLAGVAMPVADLNKASLEAELKGAADELAAAVNRTEPERLELERRLEIAEAKMAALAA